MKKQIDELIIEAKRLRESGEWEDALDIGKDRACHVLKKYHPGDVVRSIGGGNAQKGKYVYVGSFRSQGVYGLYLLLNERGKLVKHDNICFESEFKVWEMKYPSGVTKICCGRLPQHEKTNK